MSAPDQSADPAVVLGDELNALAALMETCPESWADKFSEQMVAKEDQIAVAVPTSAAGAAVQLRLLRHWAREFEWGDPLEELASNLIARLERLGGQGGAP
jgi:hypothetical protein